MSERFRAAGYPWRLHCGPETIEHGLREAIGRANAERPFVVCSPSVTAHTDLVGRIEAALEGRLAGVFDRIEKDSTYASVRAATDAAAEANADLLIAVGGGSVIVANRAVAVFLAESGDPFELMTQYPDDRPAFSPRLDAPKPPIVNIPTTPTSAMNRAGTGLKNPDLDQRMEYFDPKTRPAAVILDEGALLSVPDEVFRSTATTVVAGLLGTPATTGSNPLVEADQVQAHRLALDAYRRIPAESSMAEPRLAMALAAFLQNRAEDDGLRRFVAVPFASDYAVATALHLHDPAIGQGESTSVLHASAIRGREPVAIEQARLVAESLGVWHDGLNAESATEAVAEAIEALYVSVGMPTGVAQLNIDRNALDAIAAQTVKNFNANAGQRSAEDQIANARRLLEAAW